jgi:hypothetical protein
VTARSTPNLRNLNKRPSTAPTEGSDEIVKIKRSELESLGWKDIGNAKRTTNGHESRGFVTRKDSLNSTRTSPGPPPLGDLPPIPVVKPRPQIFQEDSTPQQVKVDPEINQNLKSSPTRERLRRRDPVSVPQTVVSFTLPSESGNTMGGEEEEEDFPFELRLDERVLNKRRIDFESEDQIDHDGDDISVLDPGMMNVPNRKTDKGNGKEFENKRGHSRQASATDSFLDLNKDKEEAEPKEERIPEKRVEPVQFPLPPLTLPVVNNSTSILPNGSKPSNGYSDPSIKNRSEDGMIRKPSMASSFTRKVNRKEALERLEGGKEVELILTDRNGKKIKFKGIREELPDLPVENGNVQQEVDMDPRSERRKTRIVLGGDDGIQDVVLERVLGRDSGWFLDVEDGQMESNQG